MNTSRGGLVAGTVLFAGVVGASTLGMASAPRHSGENYQVSVDLPGGSEQRDVQTEALLRHIPGTVHVTAEAHVTARVGGSSDPVVADFLRGDVSSLGYTTVSGRMFSGTGEVVVSSRFLHDRGLKVGDRTTLDIAEPGAAVAPVLPADQVQVTIVGEVAADSAVVGGWDTLAEASPQPSADQYRVELIPDANIEAYEAAVTTADSTLRTRSDERSDSTGLLMIGAGAGVILLGGIGMAVWASRSGIND